MTRLTLTPANSKAIALRGEAFVWGSPIHSTHYPTHSGFSKNACAKLAQRGGVFEGGDSAAFKASFRAGAAMNMNMNMNMNIDLNMDRATMAARAA